MEKIPAIDDDCYVIAHRNNLDYDNTDCYLFWNVTKGWTTQEDMDTFTAAEIVRMHEKITYPNCGVTQKVERQTYVYK